MRENPSYNNVARRLPAIAVFCLAALITFRAFGDVPSYFGGDEAHFANHAYAVASTGSTSAIILRKDA